MYDNNIVLDLFKSIGTSNGEGGLEEIDDDNYFVSKIKDSNNFYLETINIKDLMKIDDMLKNYIKDKTLREYNDEDGIAYTHENNYIYDYIDGLVDGLDIPPIIAYEEKGPYVLDGYNRLLQHYLNKNFDVEVYIDTKAYDLFFKKQELEFNDF